MREVIVSACLILCGGRLAAQEPVEPPLDAAAPAPDAAALEPMPGWEPVGDGFEARLKALADHVKKHNPTNDHRVFNLMVMVTARTGTRGWTGRDAWNDGKVRFAVGREREVTDPLAAIQAAEAKANTLLGDPTNSRRLLDWSIDDEGVTYALVARWLTLEEQGLAPTP